MPITLINARSVLVTKLGGKLERVGKSIVTNTANPDLDFAIATALDLLGTPAADFANPTDNDLTRITSTYRFFGLAELFVLYEIWGSFKYVTESINGGNARSQAWSSMSAEILTRIGQLEKLFGTYLVGLKPLQAGTIQLPFVSSSRGEF